MLGLLLQWRGGRVLVMVVMMVLVMMVVVGLVLGMRWVRNMLVWRRKVALLRVTTYCRGRRMAGLSRRMMSSRRLDALRRLNATRRAITATARGQMSMTSVSRVFVVVTLEERGGRTRALRFRCFP